MSSTQTLYQYIILFSERRTVLTQYHDEKTSGHLGIKKTLSKISSRYYWLGLQRDQRQYIAGRDLCSKRKTDNVTKCAPMKVVHSGYPLERLATDILGELPLTKKG